MDRTRRCIGLVVHRDFAQVAICQAGQVVQAGTFATTPEGVREFAAGLGPADEVALQATGNTWAIVTVLASRAARVPPMPVSLTLQCQAFSVNHCGPSSRPMRAGNELLASALGSCPLGMDLCPW